MCEARNPASRRGRRPGWRSCRRSAAPRRLPRPRRAPPLARARLQCGAQAREEAGCCPPQATTSAEPPMAKPAPPWPGEEGRALEIPGSGIGRRRRRPHQGAHGDAVARFGPRRDRWPRRRTRKLRGWTGSSGPKRASARVRRRPSGRRSTCCTMPRQQHCAAPAAVASGGARPGMPGCHAEAERRPPPPARSPSRPAASAGRPSTAARISAGPERPASSPAVRAAARNRPTTPAPIATASQGASRPRSPASSSRPRLRTRAQAVERQAWRRCAPRCWTGGDPQLCVHSRKPDPPAGFTRSDADPHPTRVPGPPDTGQRAATRRARRPTGLPRRHGSGPPIWSKGPLRHEPRYHDRPHPLRPLPDRLPAYRRGAHGAVQLPVRPPPRRHSTCCASRTPTRTRAPRRRSTRSWKASPGSACRRDEAPVFQSTPRGAPCRGRARRCSHRARPIAASATPEELTAMREQAAAEGRPPALRRPLARPRPGPRRRPTASPVIRLKAPLEGETVVEDLVQGEVRVANAELDDMIILRSDGTPTYLHAVVVDDHDMAITHVIRGDDHLTNTFRQCMVYDAMGWRPAAFRPYPADPRRRRGEAVEAPRRASRCWSSASRATCPRRCATTCCASAGAMATRRSCRTTARSSCSTSTDVGRAAVAHGLRQADASQRRLSAPGR